MGLGLVISALAGQRAEKVLYALLHRCPVLPEDMSEKMRVVEPLYSRKGVCEVLGSRGEPLKV